MKSHQEELISVIVPVYNTEQYLSQCLDSIISSIYQNLEIICVNDASTDRSLEILNQYANKDQRIIVIDCKQNSGQAAARNIGLDAATGSLIAFVDSDDYISNELFKTLYECLRKEQSQVSVCGYWEIHETTPKQKKEALHTKRTPLTEKEWWNLYKHKHTVIMNCVWNKLYKAECFESRRFVPGIIYEDTNIQHYLLQNKMISVTAEKLYYYRKRASSTTTSKHSEKSLTRIQTLLDRAEYFEKKKWYHAKTNTLQDSIKFFYQVVFNSDLSIDRANEISLSIRPKIKSMMTIREWIMIRQKAQCWLILYCPRMYHSIRNIGRQ